MTALKLSISSNRFYTLISFLFNILSIILNKIYLHLISFTKKKNHWKYLTFSVSGYRFRLARYGYPQFELACCMHTFVHNCTYAICLSCICFLISYTNIVYLQLNLSLHHTYLMCTRIWLAKVQNGTKVSNIFVFSSCFLQNWIIVRTCFFHKKKYLKIIIIVIKKHV